MPEQGAKGRKGVRPLAAALFAVVCMAAIAALALRGPNRCYPKAAVAAPPTAAARMPENERYPYGQAAFSRFITESRGGWPNGHTAYYAWMDAQLPRTRAAGPLPAAWGAWMDDKRRALEAIADPARKAQAQRDVCATVHRRVKLAIPRFSLDRGFEFRHTVDHGERQCFLQSVLIAGLLQRAGMDAGVVMIFQNPEGAYSNNGHAVALVRFADGRAALVDASEQRPFIAHGGLFAWDAAARDYRFLNPVYAANGAEFTQLRRAAGGTVSLARTRDLPLDFLRSQFEYYRGERVPGGVLAEKPTPTGLAASARHFDAAIRLAAANPLPHFMRLRVLERRNEAKAAATEAATVRRLYNRYGWVPEQLKAGGAQ